MTELLQYRVRRLFNDRPNPTFRVRPWTRGINWGCSTAPVGLDSLSMVSNSFAAVKIASNKLSTFLQLKGKDGVRIPEFTTERDIAAKWLADGITVVCRTILSGHSGAGILLVSDKDAEFPRAPLYVQYVKKQKEFRVHVAFGEVIDVQEKRKRKDVSEEFQTNFQVRNHHTGWVYCREDIRQPDGLLDLAKAAVSALGLDFGGVDIIWNEKRNELYVLEINTACGLEGSTVDKYAAAFVRALT